ncbi:MAG TPA: tRNA preQ1(34) S-adenosylmethionine ribosyltransferase-isomerase QueA [Acidimicrobiales bacterium]|nr:tRNA preQ1(34) S-adenosylmethionine ribosyltransferase-isomerase QueA [Acidimicrobiales bacterium]
MEVPDYDLPERAIAQHPAEPRDSARLLDATDPNGTVVHRRVRDLPELLRQGDALVVNNSRVIPARLHLYKSTGGAAEVLLLGPEPGHSVWTALVRPGRRLPPGTRLHSNPDGPAVIEVGKRVELDSRDDARRYVTLLGDEVEILERTGTVALPPYIHETLADPERYQTVYAEKPGSVAAPTAGLHLTTELLQRCKEKGASVVAVDLAVGLATFKPIATRDADAHVMHAERYRVPEETMQTCARAERVVAVGTTTVRALETVAATGELEGDSRLYIRGEFPFRVVDVLITNFHMPRSSLLLLLESFCGARWRDLYREALGTGYRFLSFGDAMIVGRR